MNININMKNALLSLTVILAGVVLCGCPSSNPSQPKAGLYKKILENNNLTIDEKNRLTMARMHNNSGLQEFRKKHYYQATERFKKAIAIIPDYADALNNLGRTYYVVGQFGNALTMLQEAADIVKTLEDDKGLTVNIWSNIGDVYRQTEEYKKAEDAYKKALKKDPANARIYCEIGNMMCKTNRWAESIEMFNKTLELDANFTKALLNRAISYYFMKIPDKAWRDIDQLEKMGYKVAPDFRKKVLKALGDKKTSKIFRPGS